MVLALLVFLPLHGAVRLARQASPFPRLFLRTTAWLAGARVIRSGEALRHKVMFIANHTSWLDILILGGASGTAFVAKQELAKIPVVGWLCRINRTIFVSRADRMGVADQISDLRRALTGRWSIAVFPEGTTTDNRRLLPFKTSILSVLEPSPPGAMVQPVMLDYGEVGPDIGWMGEESGLDNARRVLGRKGTFPVRIHYLEPFSPAMNSGRKAIGQQARRQIETALSGAVGPLVRDTGDRPSPSAPRSAL